MNVDAIIAAIPGKTREERRRLRENADRLSANGSPAQREAAGRVLSALDAHEAAEAERQQADRDALRRKTAGRSVADRVKAAFDAVPPTATDAKVIQVLLDNPGLTSRELSERLGWGGVIWHTHFGKMCRDREPWLWPAEPARDANFYCGILADLDEAHRWSMKPEVADGLRAHGFEAKA